MDQKVRQDLLYRLAELRLLGRRHLAAIVKIPQLHRASFFPDSGQPKPSPTSPTLRLAPW